MNRLQTVSGNRWFWLLPAAGALLAVWILKFDGLYGQDSFEYLRYARALHVRILGGTFPGVFEWPVLYPLTGALLAFLVKDVLALQLLSVLCYAAAGLFLEKLLRLLYPARTGSIRLYLVLFYLLSPFVLRYSLTVMSDLMALCLVCASWYAYGLYLNSRRPAHFFWLTTVSAAAVLTRYPACLVVMIPVIHGCLVFLRRFSLGWFLGTVAVAGGLLLLEDLLHGRMLASVSGKASLQAWSFLNYLRSSFSTADGRLEYSLPNLVSAFRTLVHPGFIAAGILFLTMMRREDLSGTFRRALVASFLLYTLFIAGLGLQNDRLLLLSFPLVLLLYCGPFLRLASSASTWPRALKVILVVAIVCLQGALCYRAIHPFLVNNHTAKFLAEELRKYPGRVVYTFNVDAALSEYGVGGPVISLYADQQGSYSPGALVLFNPSAFYNQWKGRAPMTNWEDLVHRQQLKLLKRYPDGWILCQIGH